VISIFTVGWPEEKMAAKQVLLALPLFFMASLAMGGAHPVDVELLEFMGEFETSAGKPVDPAQFAKNGDTSRQEDAKESAPSQKKGKTVRKEKEDEKNLHR
jgi:hypothetical protein